MSLTRRDFTAKSALTGAGVALAGSVGALATAPNALAATDIERRPMAAGRLGVSSAGEGAGLSSGWASVRPRLDAAVRANA